MGITENLRRVWLFSANKIKSSESFSKEQESVPAWSGFDFFYMALDRKCEEMLVFYSK